MITKEKPEVYIGIKRCGCVVAAIMITCSKEEVNDTLNDWRGRGLTIDLVSAQEARDRIKICRHKKSPAKDIQNKTQEVKK